VVNMDKLDDFKKWLKKSDPVDLDYILSLIEAYESEKDDN